MNRAWYRGLFDERYLAFYEELFDTSTAAQEAQFLDRALCLAPGSRVLDLGCGFGRHSVALAGRGHRVVGVDLSPTMLSLGRKMADEVGVSVAWEERDMREIGELGPFDACVCLNTVLGYFEDPENEAVIRAVRGVVGDRGSFVLDVSNPLPLLSQWPGEGWRETSTGVRRETNRYDAMTGKLTTERVLYPNTGGRLELPTSIVRLYAPHEIVRMLRDADFEVEQVHGGLRGEPFRGTRSARQVFLARASAR